jgi:hypothetical protein
VPPSNFGIGTLVCTAGFKVALGPLLKLERAARGGIAGSDVEASLVSAFANPVLIQIAAAKVSMPATGGAIAI